MLPYINKSIYSVDQWFTDDRWLFRLKINNYQVVTIFWNLFLAALPFIFGYLLIKYWRQTGLTKWNQKIVGFLLWLVWLLFLPNTAYVISDVRHLLDYCPRDTQFRVCQEGAWMPVFFFTYGLLGWISFVYAVAQMKMFIAKVFNRFLSHVYLIVMMPIIALGVLLGLVNRFNSWDAFVNPHELWQVVLTYWTDSQSFTNLLILSILLYILYGIGYFGLKDRFRA